MYFARKKSYKKIINSGNKRKQYRENILGKTQGINPQLKTQKGDVMDNYSCREKTVIQRH